MTRDEARYRIITTGQTERGADILVRRVSQSPHAMRRDGRNGRTAPMTRPVGSALL